MTVTNQTYIWGNEQQLQDFLLDRNGFAGRSDDWAKASTDVPLLVDTDGNNYVQVFFDSASTVQATVLLIDLSDRHPDIVITYASVDIKNSTGYSSVIKEGGEVGTSYLSAEDMSYYDYNLKHFEKEAFDQLFSKTHNYERDLLRQSAGMRR